MEITQLTIMKWLGVVAEKTVIVKQIVIAKHANAKCVQKLVSVMVIARVAKIVPVNMGVLV